MLLAGFVCCRERLMTTILAPSKPVHLLLVLIAMDVN